MKNKLTITSILALSVMLTSGTALAAFAEESKTEVVRTVAEDFKTRVVEDSSLPKGIEIVVQEGKNGERTFYKDAAELKGHNGSAKSVPVLHDEITKRPVEQVVRKGINSAVIDGISDKTRKLEDDKAKRIADEAARKAEEDERKRIAEEIAQRKTIAPSKAPAASGVTSPQENRDYARSILSASDFQCLDFLAERESGWSTTASNPSSGAYGVAQSLPGNKMASAGADWQTNGKTQVNWMINYTIERYGSPCAAKATWDIQHWY